MKGKDMILSVGVLLMVIGFVFLILQEENSKLQKRSITLLSTLMITIGIFLSFIVTMGA